ncbi:MAG: SDR family oxidoreductase [Pseudomonadota bacterium]
MQPMPCDVLVTGATGLLGSAVLSALLSRGIRAAGVARGAPLALPGATWLQADLSADGAARAVLDAARPGAVVHCAALTDVDWCERHPEAAHRFNAGLTAELADWAGENGARFIYISTDSVFDGETGAYDEGAVPAPLNVYARSKLAGEAAAARAPRHLVARTNFYGWSPAGKTRLCEWALQCLRRGDPLPGFVDVLFSPLAAPELASMLAQLVDSQMRGVVHLGSSDGISKYEFLRLFARGLGYAADAVRLASVADVAFDAPRPRDTTLRTRRADELGLGPLPGVAPGLERFLTAGTGVAPAAR